MEPVELVEPVEGEVWSALSVKQPWAALLAMGVKTVEVRTWSAKRRGPLLIHASRVPDERPEAWEWVTTPELLEMTEYRGGIIGVGELTGCIRYDDAATFVADRKRHLNAPTWYVPPRLFGLTFSRLRPVPFHRCPGNTSFFRVEGFALP